MTPIYQRGTSRHLPVMLGEVIGLLGKSNIHRVVDATGGGGGYTKAILETFSESFVHVFDRDPRAIGLLKSFLKSYEEEGRVKIVQKNFRDIALPSSTADGYVFDLGLSSDQIAEADLGFSFMQNGPLDMRMDGLDSSSVTAGDIVNWYSKEELQNIFEEYADEPFASRIASAIVRTRKSKPIETTFELVDIIKCSRPNFSSSIHPATQVFQALRMAVNNELINLVKGLERSLKIICCGGICIAVSFHAAEDQIIKQFVEAEIKKGTIRDEINGFLVPSSQEVDNNPRSRSAKLRCFRKING